MKKRKPVAVSDILDALIKETKLGETIEYAQIWEQWEEIAGKHLRAHGRPQTVKEGTLRILVDSAVWMNKFGYYKWDIIRRTNRVAGKELIHDIFLALLDEDESLDMTEGE